MHSPSPIRLASLTPSTPAHIPSPSPLSSPPSSVSKSASSNSYLLLRIFPAGKRKPRIHYRSEKKEANEREMGCFFVFF